MEKESTTQTTLKLRFFSTIALILTTLLWGTTFIITKTLTQGLPIFLYLFLRYSISLIGFVPFLIIYFKCFNKRIIFTGIISGVIYFISMVFQTYGLQTTTAGKAGFITGLGTVMVPFISWIVFKKRIKLRIWIAALISVIGMGFLLLEGESGIIIGDILVLFCGLFYAIFIIVNDKNVRTKEINIFLYSFIQLIILTFLSLVSSLIFEEKFNFSSIDFNFWIIIFYMGLGATTLTFLFQNWAQQYQSSSKTAIIFALEPVFAALFGYLFGGELLSLLGLLGAGLILIAIFLVVRKNE